MTTTADTDTDHTTARRTLADVAREHDADARLVEYLQGLDRVLAPTPAVLGIGTKAVQMGFTGPISGAVFNSMGEHGLQTDGVSPGLTDDYQTVTMRVPPRDCQQEGDTSE